MRVRSLVLLAVAWTDIFVSGAAGGGVPALSSNASAASVVGYWWWTWSATTNAPKGTNLAVAFNGWADINNALRDSAQVAPYLPQPKYLSVGGGNNNGHFTAATLQATTDAITSGKLKGYQGICYDIEEGDSGLDSAFSISFRTAKAHGLKVLVTVSHSAPYGVPDAARLMRSFFPNSDIDYLSPQLYTSGDEWWNDYGTQAGVTWSEYAASKAAVVPSIVQSSLYADAVSYFRSQGVTLQGYMQWAQV